AQPAIAEGGDGAEEDDPLDVECADQRGDRLAERGARLVDDLRRPRLAPVVVERLRRPGLARAGARAERVHIRLAARGGGGASLDRAHPGDRLQAAGPTAAAERTVVVDDRVPDLARTEAVALEQRTAEDQAGTDAGPDPDRDQVRHATLAGERVLGEGGRLGVVRDIDRDAVALGDD